MTIEQRRFNAARATLQKDAEFLGITLGELLEDIKTNGPGSYPILVIEAHKTYIRSPYYA